MIAAYTVFIGGFCVLSLLTGRSRESAGQSETAAIIECVQTFVHSLGLLAGLKGMVGVMYRDPRRLRVLLIYHIGDLAMRGISIVFREVEACEELARLQRQQKMLKIDCPSARVVLLVEFCIHSIFFSYVIFIIWSLIVRLEAGELGSPPFLGEHELDDHAGESWPPWLFVGHPGETNAALLQNRTPLNTGGPAVGAPAPFSGAPRTLQDQPQSQGLEPFRGTPHRLE